MTKELDRARLKCRRHPMVAGSRRLCVKLWNVSSGAYRNTSFPHSTRKSWSIFTPRSLFCCCRLFGLPLCTHEEPSPWLISALRSKRILRPLIVFTAASLPMCVLRVTTIRSCASVLTIAFLQPQYPYGASLPIQDGAFAIAEGGAKLKLRALSMRVNTLLAAATICTHTLRGLCIEIWRTGEVSCNPLWRVKVARYLSKFVFYACVLYFPHILFFPCCCVSPTRSLRKRNMVLLHMELHMMCQFSEGSEFVTWWTGFINTCTNINETYAK